MAGPTNPAPSGVIPAGRSLEALPLGGKTAEEARAAADEFAARLLAHPVTLHAGSRTQTSIPARLGVSADVRAALDALLAPEPDTGLLDRIREKLSGPEPVRISLALKLDEEKLRAATRRLAAGIGKEPRNARLTKVDGKFVTTPPRPGVELDYPAAAQSILAALEAPDLRDRLSASLSEQPDRGAWLKAQKSRDVSFATRAARPTISLEELKPITALLSTFTTSLGASSRNRVHNVTLACKAVDGTVLLPGDVFSYNETVGPRIASAGFKEAPVLVRGQLQQGTGGGICQVSSTLYNAVLMADLGIVRRRHHGIPVSYVPAGRDATVVDGAIDFRFKNTLPHPVAIDAKVVGRRVAVNVYGHPEDKKVVEIRTGRVSRVSPSVRAIRDPRLPSGRRVVVERAQPGRRVTVYRVVKEAGKVVREEVVSRDYYSAFPGVVRVGTAPARRPAAKPAPTTAGGTPVPATPPSSPAPPPGDML